ncbi:stalk domain-containing protein [Paenibacillus aceris]|uniref:stalk domain-containing protein n=1 Tax=Paenibacillus aceris TaxID=869555 RepID=UPI003B84979B
MIIIAPNNTGREQDAGLVRIRPFLESMNYTIKWNEFDKTVVVTKNNRNILLDYSNNFIMVDSLYEIQTPI